MQERGLTQSCVCVCVYTGRGLVFVSVSKDPAESSEAGMCVHQEGKVLKGIMGTCQRLCLVVICLQPSLKRGESCSGIKFSQRFPSGYRYRLHVDAMSTPRQLVNTDAHTHTHTRRHCCSTSCATLAFYRHVDITDIFRDRRETTQTSVNIHTQPHTHTCVHLSSSLHTHSSSKGRSQMHTHTHTLMQQRTVPTH